VLFVVRTYNIFNPFFIMALLTVAFSAAASQRFYKYTTDLQGVRASLLKEGFVRCTFTTHDGYRLSALYYSHPQPRGTVIICNGLCCPKEAMAPIRTVFQEQYNILLFDSRGHGQSSGSLLHRPWRYGFDDFHDVVAALDFVRKKSDAPIILYGNCAGAFHAVRACIFLMQTANNSVNYNIKTIIFDSGWASIQEASRTSLSAKIKVIFAKYLKKAIGANALAKIRSLWCWRFYEQVIDMAVLVTHKIVCAPFLHTTETCTNLYDKIHTISLPILFIHSLDDQWVAIDNAIEMSLLAKNSHCWWITKPSLHATHHILHNQEYHQKVNQFLDCLLPKDYLLPKKGE
jgi:pimeloyl-ACP methyl ester carboxylesterase